jgi:hypothetical protein
VNLVLDLEMAEITCSSSLHVTHVKFEGLTKASVKIAVVWVFAPYCLSKP